MYRLALILDGYPASANLKALKAPKAPPAFPVFPACLACLALLDSKIQTCSLHTHLHKAGSALVLVLLVLLVLLALPDLMAFLWATHPRDGFHLVRVSRPTGLVRGIITPFLQAHQSVHKVLLACHNSNDRHLVCPQILWGLRERFDQLQSELVRTSQTGKPRLRCHQSPTCTAKAQCRRLGALHLLLRLLPNHLRQRSR